MVKLILIALPRNYQRFNSPTLNFPFGHYVGAYKTNSTYEKKRLINFNFIDNKFFLK